MQSAPLSPFEAAAVAVTRRYPLASGCGTLASSALAKWLVKPRAETAVANVRGRKCVVPLDDYVGRALVLFGDLDPKVTWVIDRYVQPGDRVADIGANLGLVTLMLGAKLGETGCILVFEPARAMLGFLERTLRLNADLNAKLFPFALGRSEDRLTLSVPGQNAGAASLLPGHVPEAIDSYAVPVRRLADVLREEGITALDFMKIDVEGFESEVLAGLFDDPAAPRPKLVLFEDNRPVGSQVFGMLAAAGYRVYGLPKRLMRPTLVPGTHPAFLSCHDYVAVHASADSARLRRLGL